MRGFTDGEHNLWEDRDYHIDHQGVRPLNFSFLPSTVHLGGIILPEALAGQRSDDTVFCCSCAGQNNPAVSTAIDGFDWTQQTVASGTGAVVADLLLDPNHASCTIIVSYVLWGVGICLLMIVYVIYFQTTDQIKEELVKIL